MLPRLLDSRKLEYVRPSGKQGGGFTFIRHFMGGICLQCLSHYVRFAGHGLNNNKGEAKFVIISVWIRTYLEINEKTLRLCLQSVSLRSFR